jgi:hypothetical protein
MGFSGVHTLGRTVTLSVLAILFNLRRCNAEPRVAPPVLSPLHTVPVPESPNGKARASSSRAAARFLRSITHHPPSIQGNNKAFPRFSPPHGLAVVRPPASDAASRPATIPRAGAIRRGVPLMFPRHSATIPSTPPNVTRNKHSRSRSAASSFTRLPSQVLNSRWRNSLIHCPAGHPPSPDAM